MYRDDQEALRARAESATREADQLRRENEAMRRAVGGQHGQGIYSVSTLAMSPAAVYTSLDLRQLPFEERARLARHELTTFPVWLVGVLNVLTFGLFPLIHFGLIHDRLPRAAANDPTAGKAIGFNFIPYYNLYWIFFSALRLCDRLTLQYRVRGLRGVAPKGIVLAACILTVIPYVNLLIGIPVLWTIAACYLQSCINDLATRGPNDWDASEVGGPTAAAPSPAPYQFAPMPIPTKDQRETMRKAQTLVNWSHVLGWGGLGVLLLGTSAAVVLAGGAAASVVAGIAAVSMITGAIIGQIGRGMQGRAI